MAKKPVECLTGQRRIIARCLAIYANDSNPESASWMALDHKEAEALVAKADEAIEGWLSGGSVFSYILEREVSNG